MSNEMIKVEASYFEYNQSGVNDKGNLIRIVDIDVNQPAIAKLWNEKLERLEKNIFNWSYNIGGDLCAVLNSNIHKEINALKEKEIV